MSSYRFTLVIDGDAGIGDRIDALFEAGCDDAAFSHGSVVSYGDFDREASGLLEAVLSAVAAVDSVRGLTVRRVDEDDLVSVGEIADRLGRSRQSVNQLIAGQRGDGSFPPPLTQARGHARVWSWAEVARWADPDHDADVLAILQAINGMLALRRASTTLGLVGLRRLLRLAAAA